MRYSEFLIETYEEDRDVIKIANIVAKFLANELVREQAKKKYLLKDIPNIDKDTFTGLIDNLVGQATISLVQKIKKSKEIEGIVDFKNYHVKLKIPQFDKDELKLNFETNKLYYPELEIKLRRVLVHELAHILDALKSSYHLKDSNKPYLQDPIEIGARIRQGMDLISFTIDNMVEKSKSNDYATLFLKLKEKLHKLIPKIIKIHFLDNPYYNSRERRVYKKKYQHIKTRLYLHAVKYLEQKLKEQSDLDTF